MNFRHGTRRIREDAHGPRLFGRIAARRTGFDSMREHRHGRLRNTLMQQQIDRPKRRICREPPLHWSVEQQIGKRQQAHSGMMCHDLSHGYAVRARRQPRRCVIDCFIESVCSRASIMRQSFQVFARRFRSHHQSERCGVRGDDKIFGEASLESQSRNTKGAILVVESPIDHVVARFRNAPRHSALTTVIDLSTHNGAARLIEQRAFICGHDKHRHQILEHRTAPAQQSRCATGAGQQSAKCKPVFLTEVPLGDEHETGEACFRGEQVIAATVDAILTDVVSNREEIP